MAQDHSKLGVIPLAAIEIFRQALEIENMSDQNSERSVKADNSEDGPRKHDSLLPHGVIKKKVEV